MDCAYNCDERTGGRRKHGIHFAKASGLWRDSSRVRMRHRRADQPCWMPMGNIDQTPRRAVSRQQGEGVRLIAVAVSAR